MKVRIKQTFPYPKRLKVGNVYTVFSVLNNSDDELLGYFVEKDNGETEYVSINYVKVIKEDK